MVFGLVLTLSTNNSVFRLCQVLSIFFSLSHLASVFQRLQLLTFSFNCLFISFTHIMFGVLPSHQNSTNFSISDISSSCSSSPSSVLKNPFWYHWKMILSCFLPRFPSHFSNFIFFYLSLSSHCSLAFLRLKFVVSFSIKTLNSLTISFSFLVAFLRCLLLYSLLLVFATICCTSLISFFNFRFRLFPRLALFSFLSPWSPSTNFLSLKAVALPIVCTLSLSLLLLLLLLFGLFLLLFDYY